MRAEETAAPADNCAPATPKTHLSSLVLRSLPADGLHHTSYGIMPAVPVADFFFENGFALPPRLEPGRFHVGIHHNGDQVAKPDSRLPAEFCARFAWVRYEYVHFQRTEVSFGHLHVTLPIQTRISKCFLDEFTNRVGFAGADHEIIRGILLQDLPHRFHILGRVAPVAGRIKISQVERIFTAGENGGPSARNLWLPRRDCAAEKQLFHFAAPARSQTFPSSKPGRNESSRCSAESLREAAWCRVP